MSVAAVAAVAVCVIAASQLAWLAWARRSSRKAAAAAMVAGLAEAQAIVMRLAISAAAEDYGRRPPVKPWHDGRELPQPPEIPPPGDVAARDAVQRSWGASRAMASYPLGEMERALGRLAPDAGATVDTLLVAHHALRDHLDRTLAATPSLAAGPQPGP